MGFRRSTLAVVAVTASIALPAGAFGAARFVDVGADATHAAAIAWLLDNGITEGCDDGTRFCGDRPVTRDQLASFLQRLATSGAVDAGSVDGRSAADLVGPQGPTGPAGPVGPAGPAGPSGPAGAKGETGPQGVPGAPGQDGAAGPAGADGVSGYTIVTAPRVQFASGTVSATANCPTGKVAIGGGFTGYEDSSPLPHDWRIVRDGPVVAGDGSATAWHFLARYTGTSPDEQDDNRFDVHVICMTAPAPAGPTGPTGPTGP